MTILINILAGFWEMLLEMAPFLLFGFFAAGTLSLFITKETVQRHLGRGRFLPVLKASLFGVPLPLCSCSVIPVATSLRQQGANRGATTAFLISTPQTGVDSIFVTYSLLGGLFAIFRPVAAFLSGVIGGLVVARTERKAVAEPPAEAATASCCCCHAGNEAHWLVRLWRHGFVTLPRDIAGPLLVGLFIAGAIGAVVPDDFFASYLGHGFLAKLVMMAVSIPIYVCATASVPVAAALIGVGVSPGAALVFLMAGPATNAATITTLWKMMGRETAVAYLAVVGVGALVCGILLDLLYTSVEAQALPAAHHMLPHSVRWLSAVGLLVLLLWARFGRRPAAKAA